MFKLWKTGLLGWALRACRMRFAKRSNGGSAPASQLGREGGANNQRVGGVTRPMPPPRKDIFGFNGIKGVYVLAAGDTFTLYVGFGRSLDFLILRHFVLNNALQLLDSSRARLRTEKIIMLEPRKELFMKDGLTVCFEALPEWSNMHSHFVKECGWTEEEYAKVVHFDWFVAKVSVWKDGVERGNAHLGGCCYEDATEFYTKYKDDYFADMVEEAFIDATVKALEGEVA